MRYLLTVALLLAVAYAAMSASLFTLMQQPPVEFAAVWATTPGPIKRILPMRPLWLRARAGQLEVGDPAPDFELPTHDKKSTVRLSSFQGERPVVLVFGSYT